MYNADRRSKEFIDGVHYFLSVAKANKKADGFIRCPCSKCKNEEYSKTGTIHFHLFLSGFMPSYNCWTSHGELGVRMEEDEMEDENIPEWDHCGGFEKDTTVDTGEGFEDNVVADDFDQIILDV